MKRVITDMKSWTALTLMVQERFSKRKTPLMISIGKPPKSHEQLGYLHAKVLPVLAEALHDTGEIRNNSEREAKYYLKVQIGYGSWIEFRDGVVFDPDSFADADTEMLTRAINTAIDECEKRGFYVKPPKEKK